MKVTHFLTPALLLLCAASAFGNIANPDLQKNKSKVIDTTLSIRLDKDAPEARLIIPRSQVRSLRAELERLENAGDNLAAIDSGDGDNGIGGRTIAAGSFLSLAIAFGGFWFIRSGNLNAKGGKAAAAAFICFSAAFATLVYANAGPPSEARSITGKMFSQAVHLYGFGSGKIKLEVSDTERIPTLIVPNPTTTTAPAGEE